MDVATLAKDVAEFLVPALPYLTKAGEEAVKEVGKKISGEALDYARSLWAKLRPKAETTPLLKGAVEEVVAAPEDGDVQAQLRHQLKKLLADDAELARELDSILQNAKRAGVKVNIASGERAAVLDQANNNIVITGDQTYER
jgi:hypothetical protein